MKHVKSHTVEKHFQCGNCDKAFPDESENAILDKSMLMGQLRIHTVGKPHQCSIRHKAFSLEGIYWKSGIFL